MRGKNKKALEEFLEFSIEQINNMVQLVRGDLNKLQRNVMGAIIVLDVHAREVVRNMIKVRVDNINDFDWTCQLRYYQEPIEGDEETLDIFAK
jgi:dynein heavy chain, axonemal